MEDRYRQWSITRFPPPGKSVEAVVLEDLEKAETTEEKTSILRDFTVYNRRQYRAELLDWISGEIGRQVGQLTTSMLGSRLEQLLPDTVRGAFASRICPIQKTKEE